VLMGVSSKVGSGGKEEAGVEDRDEKKGERSSGGGGEVGEGKEGVGGRVGRK